MNLQEHIRQVLREETELPIFIRRRVTDDDLEWLVNDVKELIDYGESLDTAIYDGTREFIKSRKFPDIYEFGPDADYWESYLRYERPLVDYVKKKLRITDNVNESILREESKMSTYLRRGLEMLGEGYDEDYEKLIFSKKYSSGFFDYCRKNIDEIVKTLLSDAYYEFKVYDLIIVLTIDDLVNANNQRTLGEYDDDNNTLTIVMFSYFKKFLGGLDDLYELSKDEKELIGRGIRNILVTPNNEFTEKIQSNINKVFYHEMIHHFDNVKYGKKYSDSVNRLELIKYEIEDEEKRLGYYVNMSHEIDANFISTLAKLIDNHGEGYGDFRTFQEMFLDYFPRWEILSKDNKNKVIRRLYKFFEKL